MKLLIMQFSPSHCYFLSLLGPNIPLRNLFPNILNLCDISGSHGGEYEDSSLLGILRPAVSHKLSDVSDVRLTHRPDDGGSRHH
jgi:hypothetical protein